MQLLISQNRGAIKKKTNIKAVCIQPGQMYAMNIQNMFRRDFHLLYLLIPVGVMANDCTEF